MNVYVSVRKMGIALWLTCLAVFFGLTGPARTAYAGTTWTQQASGTAETLSAVGYGNGLWVVGGYGNTTLSSADGTAWTPQVAANDWNAVAYSGTTWSAVGYNGVMGTSPDGVAWTLHNVTTADRLFYDLAFGNGVFAAPEHGAGKLWWSTDGVSWTETDLGGVSLNGLTYGGGRFVAVGANGASAVSTDGQNWTPGATGQSEALWDVAYGNSTYVAVGENGAILTSSDGTAWNGQTSNTAEFLYSITYGNGAFVAVGTNGTILRSIDGITWSGETSPVTGVSLQKVAFGGGQFVVVGDQGTVLTSNGLSDNADLSGLTVSAGTLTPAFDTNTLNYSVSVDYGTATINVAPTAAEPGTTITVNGSPVGGGSVPVPLTPGDNPISIVVTAQNGSTKTYTITVSRAAPLTNADLASIAVSAGTLTPAFSTATLDYTVAVPHTQTSVDLTATADATATLTVNGTATPSGAAVAVNLTVGANPVTVEVTAQDGATKKSYSVNITRAAPATDASLSNLQLSAGSLTPAFAPATLTYAASVSSGVSSLQLTATVNHPAATMTVNTAATASGAAADLALGYGANQVSIQVKAEDGVTEATYTVTITRQSPPPPPPPPPPPAPPPPPDPPAAPPVVVAATVSITAPATLTREESMTVTGTANPWATIAVGGTTVQASASGSWSATVSLKEGANLITATNGAASSSVTVTRDSVAPVIALTAAATVTDKDSVLLTATANEPGARIEIEGKPVASLTVQLAMGENTFTATATDAAGNRSVVTTAVKRVAPELKPVTVAVLPGQSAQASLERWTVDLPEGLATAPLQLKIESVPSAGAARQVGMHASVLSVSEITATMTASGDAVHQLQKKVKITFSYDASAVSDPTKLKLFYFDPQGQAWVDLSGVVDPIAHTITVEVDHFTLFAVMQVAGQVPFLTGWPSQMTTASAPLTGTAPAGATLTLLVNGKAVDAALADAAGRFDLTVPLTPGSNRIYVVGAGSLASREILVLHQPQQQAPAFVDVAGHWAANSINRMVTLGVVRGYEDLTFRPEARVSRLEFAVMVSRLLSLPPADGSLRFTDADRIPAWARAQVGAAATAGIITGRDTGAFDPDAQVTRAEMAIMLVRALAASGRDVAPGDTEFADGAAIPAWAKAQVLAAARYGLVTGYSDGTFRAANTATRAEAVTMLARLQDALSR